jgi:hypothetical protein
MINLSFNQKVLAQTQTQELNQLQSIAQQLGAQSSGNGLGDLINQIFYVVLAVAIVLAVSMVIRGGYEYMTSSDSGDKKSRAKRRIQAAFGGLLLAVGSVVILNSINRGITNFTIGSLGLNSVTPPADTRSNSSDPDRFLSDGFQVTDSFFAGESDQFSERILSMSNEELQNLINRQLGNSSGQNDYREFLIDMIERRDFYINGQNSNNPSIQREISRMTELIGKFSQIDSGLASSGLYQQASLINNQRQVLGITNQRGETNSSFSIPNTTTFTGGGNLVAHSLLFAMNDTESINRMYESSGGNSTNNTYSSAIISVLNNPDTYPNHSQNIPLIQNWVDQNGSSIGIEKTESGYELLD